MLDQNSFTLENAPEGISDLDITSTGQWVAVTEREISFGGGSIPTPRKLWYPKIRVLSDDSALIIDPRTRDESNAWIITSEGRVVHNFYVGDAVQDVLVSESYFVISYFDESALTSPGIESNGVTVFDKQGNFLFGYRETFADQAVNVYDCYCTCLADEDRILFFPYDEFPLVSFDLTKRSQEIFRVPHEVGGSNAISSKGNTVFFHSPYDDKTGLYEWNVNGSVSRKIGQHSGPLRGLRDGHFLSVGKSGYTIVTPS